MALNAWQLLTRVLPGRPFGDGADGAYNSATIPTMTVDSCSGTATQTTLTTAGSTFANGDILKVIQMRGTGVGQWEIVKVSSGGGTTSLTLSTALQYTYTDSGASQAQAIKIPRYTDVTASSGTWTLPAWDGNVNGDLVFACKGTFTPTATITATGKGFRGGAGSNSNTDGTAANNGEGSDGASSVSASANGNGGGAGQKSGASGPGASGGGNGEAGTNGESSTSGGTTSGDANLASMTLGGAAGGARQWEGGTAGTGGNGGGIITIFAKNITAPTSIISGGTNGGDSACVGGNAADRRIIMNAGGGAAGSILICTQTANIGTDKISTPAGLGSTSSTNAFTAKYGGNGGKGRIAIYYGQSLTGSISSTLYGTYTSAQDTSLVEASSSFFLMF